MVRYESIVTALIGAALGMAVGIFLGGLASLALSDKGVVFALPYKSLAAANGRAASAALPVEFSFGGARGQARAAEDHQAESVSSD